MLQELTSLCRLHFCTCVEPSKFLCSACTLESLHLQLPGNCEHLQDEDLPRCASYIGYGKHAAAIENMASVCVQAHLANEGRAAAEAHCSSCSSSRRPPRPQAAAAGGARGGGGRSSAAAAAAECCYSTEPGSAGCMRAAAGGAGSWLSASSGSAHALLCLTYTPVPRSNANTGQVICICGRMRDDWMCCAHIKLMTLCRARYR